MNTYSRQQLIVVAEFLEKHPGLVNIVKRSSDFTFSQANALWEELAISIGCLKMKFCRPRIESWWEEYAYELNRAYMSVLTDRAEAKLPAHYDVDLACRFLTVMGYDNVHCKLSDVKKEIIQSTDTEIKPQQHEEDLGIKVTSYSTLKTDEFGISVTTYPTVKPDNLLPVVTSVPPSVVIPPVQPEVVFITPLAQNKCNGPRITTSNVNRSGYYLIPIVSKATLSVPAIIIHSKKSDGPPSNAPIQQSSPNAVTIQPGTSESSPDIAPVQPGTTESSPNTVPIQSGKSESQPNVVPSRIDTLESSSNVAPIQAETSDCSPDIAPVQPGTPKSSPNTVTIQSGKSESQPNVVPSRIVAFESSPNVVPIQPKTSENQSNISPVKPGTRESSPKLASNQPETFENQPNLSPIHPVTSESLLSFAQVVPEKFECPPLDTAVKQNRTKCTPNTPNIKHEQSTSHPNSILTVNSDIVPSESDDSSISEKEQNGTFSPIISTEEALLSIAKEMNIENSLDRRKVELRQKLHRLKKRKIIAVDRVSKKLCLL